jgi:hypothetical protein
MHSLLLAIKSENKVASFKNKISFRGKSTIYIVRIMNYTKNLDVNANYWLGCSKPCDNCEPMLHKFNIQTIKYTDIIDGKNVLCTMKIVR